MKLFAGLVPWMLPVAAFASFAFGGLWYTVFGKAWLEAVGPSKERIAASQGQNPKLLALNFACALIMAWMLAGLILHMQKAGIPASAKNGMISALFIWAGFVATTLVVNHAYQAASRRLTLIDGGHWLGAMLIQGALIGAFGIA